MANKDHVKLACELHNLFEEETACCICLVWKSNTRPMDLCSDGLRDNDKPP